MRWKDADDQWSERDARWKHADHHWKQRDDRRNEADVGWKDRNGRWNDAGVGWKPADVHWKGGHDRYAEGSAAKNARAAKIDNAAHTRITLLLPHFLSGQLYLR